MNRQVQRKKWVLPGLIAALALVPVFVTAQVRDTMPDVAAETRSSSSAEDVDEFVEEEVEGKLFDGPDFGVVHPEVRDGALNFTVTPWAETVYLPFANAGPPVGPPWWNPGAHPAGVLILVY